MGCLSSHPAAASDPCRQNLQVNPSLSVNPSVQAPTLLTSSTRGEVVGAKLGGAGPRRFQIKLGGQWQDYGPEEDLILKRAYLIGLPRAKFRLRGQDYEYSFQEWTQTNYVTEKVRKFRPPEGMTAPSKPILPPGRTCVVMVPPNAKESIEVVDPTPPRKKFRVVLPDSAVPNVQVAVPLPRPGESVQALAQRQADWSAQEGINVPAAAMPGPKVFCVVLGEHMLREHRQRRRRRRRARNEVEKEGKNVPDAPGSEVVEVEAAEEGRQEPGEICHGKDEPGEEEEEEDEGLQRATTARDLMEIVGWLGGALADAMFIMEVW